MASTYSEKWQKAQEGNQEGRPRIYSSPEELKKRVVDYFKFCDEKKDKATITGLALFLGFGARSTLTDYANRGEFSSIVKEAKTMIENSYEEHGQTIDIFALKNMGWKDKTEVEQTTKVIKVKTS